MDEPAQSFALSQVARARSLRDYLQLIKTDDYESALAKTAADKLLAATDLLVESLESLVSGDDLSALRPSEALTQLARYGEAMNEIAKLGALVRSSSGWSSISHWERPLQRLLSPRTQRPPPSFLIHPVDVLNYRARSVELLLSPWLTKLTDQDPVKQFSGDNEGRIYLIGFPGLQVTHSLQHSLLFHELGHVYLTEHPDFQQSVRSIELSEEELAGHATTTDDVVRFTGKLQRWAIEVACDLIGSRLGGYAFLLAAAELWTLSGLDADVDSHPPGRVRIDFLLQDLADRLALANAAAPPPLAAMLDSWRTIVTPLPSRWSEDPIVAKLISEFGNVRDLVHSAVRADVQFDLAAPLGSLVERISMNVPPDASRFAPNARPSSLAEILNAGWLSYAEGTAGDPTRAVAHKAHVEALTAKAIELAEIAARWKESK